MIRDLKRTLKTGFGKIGHFGTLDPFASGLLLVGIAGAARLNNFIHDELPKTYIAYGILGKETETGDLTVPALKIDESDYLNTIISKFEISFIEEKLKEKFLGKYLQRPHIYSAAKFEGKKLHEWAREGIEIKKDEVEREIFDIKVLKYDFPNLNIEVKVSSGTYVRTLFSDFANYLGTIGVLEGLERTQIGDVSLKDLPREFDQTDSIIELQKMLPFQCIELQEFQSKLFSNGNALSVEKHELDAQENTYYWVKNFEKQLISIAEVKEGIFKPCLIIPRS